MNSIRKFEVKNTKNCIGVKESYKKYIDYNTKNLCVDLVFCIDSQNMPCRLGTIKLNKLVTLRSIEDFEINRFIKSNKAIYSRLDCVSFIVKAHIEYSQGMQGVGVAGYKIEVFSPFGTSSELLTAVNVSNNLSPQMVQCQQRAIIQNLGSSTFSKEAFIMSRM